MTDRISDLRPPARDEEYLGAILPEHRIGVDTRVPGRCEIPSLSAAALPEGDIDSQRWPLVFPLAHSVLPAGSGLGHQLDDLRLGNASLHFAVITDPPSIRRYLEGTGYSAAIPESAPARAPP